GKVELEQETGAYVATGARGNRPTTRVGKAGAVHINAGEDVLQDPTLHGHQHGSGCADNAHPVTVPLLPGELFVRINSALNDRPQIAVRDAYATSEMPERQDRSEVCATQDGGLSY